MDGEELVAADWATFVDWLANDIDDSTESLGADWHLNGITSVLHGLATDEAFGGVEGNGTHIVATQMLGDLEDETVLSALNFECVHDRGKFAFELHVDDGTDDLGNFTSSGAEAAYNISNSVSYIDWSVFTKIYP